MSPITAPTAPADALLHGVAVADAAVPSASSAFLSALTGILGGGTTPAPPGTPADVQGNPSPAPTIPSNVPEATVADPRTAAEEALRLPAGEQPVPPMPGAAVPCGEPDAKTRKPEPVRAAAAKQDKTEIAVPAQVIVPQLAMPEPAMPQPAMPQPAMPQPAMPQQPVAGAIDATPPTGDEVGDKETGSLRIAARPDGEAGKEATLRTAKPLAAPTAAAKPFAPAEPHAQLPTPPLPGPPTLGPPLPIAGNLAPGPAHGLSVQPPSPPDAAQSVQPPVLPAAPHYSARSPAGQVGPVMVSLATGGAGEHRLVLRLDPPELGRLEIRMVRAPDGPPHVEITAERPATLALLRQDEPALHRALNDAGVPADGRSLTMQLGRSGGQESGPQGGGQGWAGPRRPIQWSEAVGGVRIGLPDPALPPTRLSRSALDITA